MKNIYHILTIAATLSLISCNKSGNLNEERNEAAAESNTDKFEGKKQKDADFVFEVLACSYGEIKLAELANQRSRTSEVKQIAEKVQTENAAALNELKTFAQAKAISVPVEESDAAKRKIENIAGESGPDFDKEWCKEMMDMHDQNIGRFEERLQDTQDVELKAFITRTLPVLKNHHESLKACNEKLKNKNS